MALYGNVKMLRTWCKDCRSWCFIIDKKLQCCNKPTDETPERYRRMCEPSQRRTKPSPQAQKALLETQDHKCLYCERPFGIRAYYKNRLRNLKLEWDHLVPYSYQQDNADLNFAAVCHICNAIKGAMMFQTIEQARLYVQHEWEQKSKTEKAVCAMRRRIYAQEALDEVLQDDLQKQTLDGGASETDDF